MIPMPIENLCVVKNEKKNSYLVISMTFYINIFQSYNTMVNFNKIDGKTYIFIKKIV